MDTKPPGTKLGGTSLGGTTLGGTSLGGKPGGTTLGGTSLGGTTLGAKPGTQLGTPAAATKPPTPAPNQSTQNPNPKPKKKKKPAGGPKQPPVSKQPNIVKTFRTNDDLDVSSDEEEDVGDYQKGGYHPVAIGDRFNNKYKVKAKLGWGHFSTVWLCTDQATGVDVALKIVKSAPTYKDAALDEIKILSILTTKDKDQSCVISLLDHFTVSGINGNHVAMVFEKLGCNLLSLIRIYKYRGMPIPLVKIITKQILIGLEHIHKCQIIHTDLKPENVLTVCTPKIMRTLTQEQQEEIKNMHPKDKDTEERENSNSDDDLPPLIDTKPGEVIPVPKNKDPIDDNKPEDKAPETPKDAKDSDSSIPETKQENTPPAKPAEDSSAKKHRKGLPWTKEELMNIFNHDSSFKIKVVDLGNACWTHKRFTSDVQTREYRAPEAILGATYGTPIDMWSVACIVFELLTGDQLFKPKSGKNYSKSDDHLALMIELVGRPRPALLVGKWADEYFNRRGELRQIKKLKMWGLNDVLRQKYKMSAEDSQAISAFLLPMLKFDPRERATATHSLTDPWVKDIDVHNFETAFA